MTNGERPLHEQQPLTRFGERAGDYSRHRPDYPAAVFDTLLEGLSPPITAADIGAGTGISSRALAARGVQVLAIEPNEAMRQAARAHPRVRFLEGRGELISLPDGSVDLITCFQSFHWFEGGKALAEFHRILRPAGRLGLVWNIRDRSDAFTAAYSEIVVRYASSPAAEDRPDIADALFEDHSFAGLERFVYSNRQRLDGEGLMGRARSVSYLPRTGPRAEELFADLRALFESWNRDGVVDLVYETLLYRAVRN
ncbi:MAG: class I SAM-dependent methyltransferase [Acidobacteriota bacterium]